MADPMSAAVPVPRASAVRDSVADMRSSARWTAGALGAVGSLVLGACRSAGRPDAVGG
ncbi:hypothetical protein FHR36_007815 [Kitasatospora paracochleata]|uniref:Lipoprotein n=1 Tax=Kitasatospora paracochleata TaxID=58354 RepID=A0ABT1JBK2_9ACTN|nr:hypothetical protein [Kitasatospora paracochleata]